VTTSELKKYYADLLVIQYINKPKARATIESLVGKAIIDLLPIDAVNAYNIETAIGKQLDILGKYIGQSRNGYDFSGPVTLSDTDYRQILKLKIIQNNYGSSLSEIQNFLKTYFLDQIFVFDFSNMRIGYYVDTSITTTVLEFFIMSGLLPRPMGVEISSVIYFANLDIFFGFRTYYYSGYKNSPLNTYASYQTNRPWLKYADAVIP
jgi:hypothetical protein